MRLKRLAACILMTLIVTWVIPSSATEDDWRAIYEAEVNTILTTATASKENAGFIGHGYADLQANGAVLWKKVYAPQKGDYQLNVRYAVGGGNTASRPANIEVNGTPLWNAPSSILEFSHTGAWTNWETEAITVELEQGYNSIKMISQGSGANIDCIAITALGAEIAWEVERVEVDFGFEKGEMNHLSGLLHGFGMSGVNNDPPNELIAPLKPRYHRMKPAEAEKPAQMERAKALGITNISVISDGWGYPNGTYGWPNENWQQFDQFVTNHYNKIVEVGYNLKDIHFDIWNEANGAQFWNIYPDNTTQRRQAFIEMWIRTYRTLKELNPECIVEGPSLSDIWSPEARYSFMTMWVDAVIKENAVPDYISWHFPGESVMANGQYYSLMPDYEIQVVRDMFSARGVQCPPIIINEYLYKNAMTPGTNAWHIAQMQRMDVLGVCRATWGSYQSPTLNHLIFREDYEWKLTGEYIMTQMYAEMTGTRVNTKNSPSVDLVATKDTDQLTAKVMLGRKQAGSSMNVEVVLNNINASLTAVEGSTVAIAVKRVPYNGGRQVTFDEVMEESNTSYEIVDNKIVVNLTWANPRDCYFLEMGAGDGKLKSDYLKAKMQLEQITLAETARGFVPLPDHQGVTWKTLTPESMNSVGDVIRPQKGAILQCATLSPTITEGQIALSKEITVRILPEAGLLAHYDFEEQQGTSFFDSSGRGNHASYRGTTPPILGGEGKLGKAYEQERNAGYIALPRDIFQGTTAFTIGGWVQIRDPGYNWGTIFNFFSLDNSSYITLYQKTSGETFQLRIKSNGQEQSISYEQDKISRKAWHHVAVTLEPVISPVDVNAVAEYEVRVYQNGELKLTKSDFSIRLSDFYEVNGGLASKGTAVSADTLPIAMDDFRIYDRSLTAEEIGGLVTLPESDLVLETLAVDGEEIAGFSPNKLDYSLEISNKLPWINALPKNSNTTIIVDRLKTDDSGFQNILIHLTNSALTRTYKIATNSKDLQNNRFDIHINQASNRVFLRNNTAMGAASLDVFTAVYSNGILEKVQRVNNPGIGAGQWVEFSGELGMPEAGKLWRLFIWDGMRPLTWH